jgi:MFS family permease
MKQSATLDRAFRALRHPNYRSFLQGQAFSLSGNWMQLVAEGWLTYRVTGSSFALGAVSFVALLPVVPISFVGSSLIDRVDKRKLVLATQLGLLLNALAWAGLAASGHAQVWSLVLLSFVEGALASVDLPARQAFLPELVGMEDLPNSIALNQLLYNTTRIVGPAIAGIVIARVGEALCFLLNGLSFLPLLLALALMRERYQVVSAGSSRRDGSVIQGLYYLQRSRGLIWLLLLMAVSHFLLLPYFTLMPAVAGSLGVGAQGLGVLMTCVGIGALLGSAWLTNLQAHRQASWLIGSLLVLPLAVMGFGAGRSLAVAAAIALVVGCSTALMQTIFNTLVQVHVRDDMRGRVMSIYLMLQAGTIRGGAMAVGLVGEWIGVPLALALAAVVSLACTGGALRVRPPELETAPLSEGVLTETG